VGTVSYSGRYRVRAPAQGPVSRKFRKLFGPEKPFVRLRPAYSVKLVFSYVVTEIKVKIAAKFRASRRLRFEDTKRIMAPEICPKSFGTFEKQAPVPNPPRSDTVHCQVFSYLETLIQIQFQHLFYFLSIRISF